MENEDHRDGDHNKPYSVYHDTSVVHHEINPDCPVCSKPVFWSRHIFCLDRVWHIQCFICSYCFRQLKPGEQSFHSGKIFCTNPCFNELFIGQSTVPLVSLPLNIKPKSVKKDEKLDIRKDDKKDTKIEIKRKEDDENKETKFNLTLNQDYHHLTCTNSKHKIINQAKHNNYPYCKFTGYKENVESYYKINQKNLQEPKTQTNLNRSVQTTTDFIGQKCVRCSKKVFAAELSYSINFPFHLKCLRCSICDRILQPAAHAVHDGLPICTYPCYNRIYNNNYKKKWHEFKP